MDDLVPVPNGTYTVSEDNAQGCCNENNACLNHTDSNIAAIALNYSQNKKKNKRERARRPE
jgi:hypothetical protein